MTNAPPLPGETPRDALARRLAETAEKEVWNGSTLVGPHRDDLVVRARRPRPRRRSRRAASSGPRSSPSSWPSSTSLTALDGRPPLLLLDDVFSELDPDRRAHLVRRIAALPQAFVTTTTLDDLDPALRAIATAWEVRTGRRRAPGSVAARRDGCRAMSAPRRRPMVRIGDLIPDAARGLGLEDELRLARAIATFEALVAERVPAAAGACRVVRLEGFALDVEADAPIVAQELRLRSDASCWPPSRPRRAGVGVARVAGPRPARGSPRIIPRTCQPPRGDRPRPKPTPSPIDLVRPSPRPRAAGPA